MEGATVESSQGPGTGEEAELQLSTAAARFPQQLIWLQFLGKGERGGVHSSVAAAWCSLLTIHGRSCMSNPSRTACQSLMLCLTPGLCSEQAPLLLCLDLAQAAGKPEEIHFLLTEQVWELPRNTNSFQFDTHLWFATSGNHAQEFNDTNATESRKRETGK